MTVGGERFDGFTTTAEERWLVGQGPEPARPQDRLPERSGLLVPRAGAGTQRVADLRTVRLWVDPAGDLQLRDRTGQARRVAPAGSIHACWWVLGAATGAVGLSPAEGGWLVLVGRTGPVFALRMSDWLPPVLAPEEADALRSAGAGGLASALGADLEAVADPVEASERVGAVPEEARFVLDPVLARPYAGAVLAVPLLALVLYWLLLTFAAVQVATTTVIVVLALMPLFDLVPLALRYRRTDRLPRLASGWWSVGRGRHSAGIGLVDGPAGPELVLADGRGWEAWFPGPSLGGAASLVLAHDEADTPWGLVLHDRDQRVLAVLAAADWVRRPGSAGSLAQAAGELGLVVSQAVRAPVQLPSGRRLSRPTGPPADVYTALPAAFYAGVLCALFWLSAMWDLHRGPAQAFIVTGAALLGLRLLLRWRRVL